VNRTTSAATLIPFLHGQASLSRRAALVGAAALTLTPFRAAAQNLPPLSPAQRSAAVSALTQAETHGLAPMAPGQQASDQEVLQAIADYGRAVRSGRLSAEAFPRDWGVRPPAYDPAADMAAALATDRFEAWLQALPPPYAGYRGLKRALARYRDIAAAGGWDPVPTGAPFGLGEKGPRVLALRTRLKAEDLAVPTAGGAVFDRPLQQALIKTQRRFGLKPDGVVDAGTLAALNQPVGQRILQIIANMERWRWLPRTMPATRVQVNSGAAIVTLFKDDKPVLSMKAVAGRQGDETPMLVAEIHSIVLNPPWNVPTSIATRELWPKEKSSPGYLRRNGFTVIADGEGPGRLQQRPGPKSALGRYKFDFENPYGVYLHDTPAQVGFTRYTRQASHGCVRLEKPSALAEALLEGSPQWTPDKIKAAVAKGQTVRASLPAPAPVYILYWTAFVGAEEQVHFRSDPYGWDRLLLQKVGVVGPGRTAT
jgi:L,D-transpeptidase YcbB